MSIFGNPPQYEVSADAEKIRILDADIAHLLDERVYDRHEEALAQLLDVSVEYVTTWTDDAMESSNNVFLQALICDTPRRASQSANFGIWGIPGKVITASLAAGSGVGVPPRALVDDAQGKALTTSQIVVAVSSNNAMVTNDSTSLNREAAATALVSHAPIAETPALVDNVPKDVWMALTDLKLARDSGQSKFQLSHDTLIPLLAYASHDAHEVHATDVDARISSFMSKGAYKQLASVVEPFVAPSLGNWVAKVVGAFEKLDEMAKNNYDCPGETLIRLYSTLKIVNETSAMWEQGKGLHAEIGVIDYVAMHVSISTLSSVVGDILNRNIAYLDEVQIKAMKNALEILFNNTGQCSFHIATIFGDAQTNEHCLNLLKRQEDDGRHGYTTAGNFHGGLVNERALQHMEDALLLVCMDPYNATAGWSGKVTKRCTVKQFAEGECDGEKYALWIRKDMFNFIFRDGQHLAITDAGHDDTPKIVLTTNTSPEFIPKYIRWLFLQTSDEYGWVLPIDHRFKHARKVAMEGIVHQSFLEGVMAMLKDHWIAGILDGLCPSFIKHIMKYKRLSIMLFSDITLLITQMAIWISKMSIPAFAQKVYNFSDATLRSVVRRMKRLCPQTPEHIIIEWAMPYLKIAWLFGKPLHGRMYYLLPPPIHNMVTGQASLMVPFRTGGYMVHHLGYMVNAFRKIELTKEDFVYYRGRICRFDARVDANHMYLKGRNTNKTVCTKSGDPAIPALDMHVLMCQQKTVVNVIARILVMAVRDPVHVPR